MSGRARADAVAQFLELVWVLVVKELKLRYRGTTLGILWSLANPLAFAAVLYVAFKRVFQVDIEQYPLFILSALFPWQWLSNSLTAASTVFIYNASLIKKVKFPRFALCLAVVLGDLVHFLVTVPVFTVLVLATGNDIPVLTWLAGIPIMIVAQAGFTLAAVVTIATLNAYLRDLEQLVRVFLLLLFYVTPVLFSVTMMPAGLGWLVLANPVAPFVVAWRALLVDGAFSPYIGVAVLYAVLAVVVMVPIYQKLEWRLPELV